MSEIMIEKRDKSFEPLQPEKYHYHLEYAFRGYEHLSMSEVEMRASVHIVNGTKSEDIQKAFIRSTAEMIYDNPDYEVPAGRMLNQELRKEVYGSHTPDDLITVIKRNCEKGLYDGDYLFKYYTEEEIIDISKAIDYTKDEKFGYGGLKKNIDSYLLKQFGVIVETPQEMYMMIQLFVFAKYKEKYNAKIRKQWVINGYEILSNHEVSLPTPMIKQLRSAFRHFISCVLIPFGDDKRTIANASRATLLLVSGGAGLGLMLGDIRGLGGDIDNGRIEHTGLLPIAKAEEKTTKAFTQPDRDGSATAHYPFFHREISRIMVLGNARGTDDTRVRDMDHAILFNDYFFERYYNDDDVTLFNMNDVLDLNSYLGDYAEFKKRYEYAEATVPKERTTIMSAKLLFHAFVDERFLQSREYADFMDNIMVQGMWKVPIKESNLCVSGRTRLLTKEYGNTAIGPLVERGVKIATCWNGKEWSPTPLVRTSNSANMLTVYLSSGVSINSTDYHKWYIKINSEYNDASKIICKRTYELVSGDEIIDYELEICDHGDKILVGAYKQGKMTARTGNKDYDKDTADGLFKLKDIYPNYYTPSIEIAIESRIEWLAGLLDGAGEVCKGNDDSLTVTITGVNKTFLTDVKYLLLELGVDSNIAFRSGHAGKIIPVKLSQNNNSSIVYELSITGSNINKLLTLGLVCKKIKLKQKSYSNTTPITTILYVDDEGVCEATYCGTEPKRNMLMFNGVLTGNCQEITTPNYPMYNTINLRRNIVFPTPIAKILYYDLRNKLYYIQVDDSKHQEYLNAMRELYDFVNDDIVAPVDESLDYDYFDQYGYVNMSEIGVCIIAGINLGMTTKERIALVSEYLVRLEDELIDYMDYDLPEIEKAAKMRRTIGIGFSDVAHLLAKNKVKYNTREGRQLFHDYVELAAYHMTKTSIQLAADFGPCKLYRDTKYADGVLPHDTYRKSVDELVTHNNQKLDWEALRADLLIYGIRHSTLMANAPFGSSSIPSNSTPGVEFPRNLIAKKSGLPKIVPEYNLYKDYYTTLWSDEYNNIDYFKFIACGQKYMDQSISLNQNHDLTRYPENKVPKSLLVEEILVAIYYGIKSLYYLNVRSYDKTENEEVKELDNSINSNDTAQDIPIEEDEGGGCGSGGCKI